jgi:uncharacterized protein (TIGR03663 family)
MAQSNRFAFIFIFAATLAALALRLPKLEQRPMHGDEAVHAIKFGALLEKGFYRYDSFEYHGPTLNYATLIPAWLSSAKKLTEVTELTLRLVPVFFGTLLVFMPLLLVQGLGKSAVVIAALLTAISPAMAYYSRYYIQEMLLVCFTFGVISCGYRYTQNKNFGWALATGIFLGLMHATKETCIIAWGAMGLALFFSFLLGRRDEGASHFITNLKALKRRHVVAALVAAGAVSALFYSSFFTHAQGVADSILAYKTYLSRAGHDPVHIHPWHYYLKLLAYFRLGENPFWSEALILLLAAAGFIFALKKKSGADLNLLRFLAFYTLVMTIAYSLIPYKTPWNLISFLHGMILLAGTGAVAIAQMLPAKFVRAAVIALMLIGGAHLSWQAYLANYKYDENPANPYVYAHPVHDVFTMVKRVEEIARAHPDGYNLYMQVISPANDYWPLPWYLRAFPNIGWWPEVDASSPSAPLIIAAAKVEPALMRKLYELPPPGQRPLYVPLFDGYVEMRPQIEWRGYVRKDLWDRYEAGNP